MARSDTHGPATPVASWGRLDTRLHAVRSLNSEAEARRIVVGGAGLPHGLARSYGDVCLNTGHDLWVTLGMDRLRSFDRVTGVLRCDAGVTLGEIQRIMIPRGWWLPVTPGTQYVTVGGAIANDVHGKSHHRHGAFGAHVRRMRLLRTTGEEIDCGPSEAPEWFAATVGGLGLTGLILWADLQLERTPGPWLESESLPFSGVSDFLALSAESAVDWGYTVAWVDCAVKRPGRGVFMRGRPVVVERSRAIREPLRIPVAPPMSLVNGWSVRAFNTVFQAVKRLRRRATVHYTDFFYPLDGVRDWNLVYGPRGFFQYQCVLPPRDMTDAATALLREIERSGEGSFLSVLKTFGDHRSTGMMSFPVEGLTFALDFPNRGDSTRRLLDRLDAVVLEAGGRLYLAKDARMSRTMFEAGYPAYRDFLAFKDPGISSDLFGRLMEHA
ncbi:FAD-binding oxidoreductase [Luteitalea sp.]